MMNRFSNMSRRRAGFALVAVAGLSLAACSSFTDSLLAGHRSRHHQSVRPAVRGRRRSDPHRYALAADDHDRSGSGEHGRRLVHRRPARRRMEVGRHVHRSATRPTSAASSSTTASSRRATATSTARASRPTRRSTCCASSSRRPRRTSARCTSSAVTPSCCRRENFCNGQPFSDGSTGDVLEGTPLTVAEAFQRAIVSADSGLLAVGSASDAASLKIV